MNRLHHLSYPPVDPESRYEIGEATRTKGHGDGNYHAVFAPLHYEPNYAYPLVVWLHGERGDERQLQRVMPEISMRNYVGVGPRGPIACSEGFSWSDCAVESAERAVFHALDAACARFHISSERIFLAGYESGGTAAFQVGLRHPEFFAGVMSAGGPFPLGRMPLARLAEARHLPLFIAQARDSKQYPVDRTCDELRLFHSAGLSVNLRQYPCPDELNVQMLRDMDAWMMERVTGVPAAEDSNPEYFDGQLN